VIAVIAIVGAILIIENPFAPSVVETSNNAVSSEGAPPIGTNIGWQAPGFRLQSIDGDEVSLGDFRGKVVLVNFWATWCPFCVNEMPNFQQLNEDLSDEIVILGINRAESSGKQNEFFTNDLDVKITYILLNDPTDAVAKSYGVEVMPTTYFLNEDGVVMNRKLGELTLREMKILVAESGSANGLAVPPQGQAQNVGLDIDISSGPVLSLNVAVINSNGVKHTVPLDRIFSGGPPKDGIPSIDRPKFITPSEADRFLKDDDLVLGIVIDGVAKAYPRKIMVWHEIANDEINGIPVVITYCPLCYTGAAYVRIIDGEPVEFGVSGKLYNSDLVMYDRKTNTYWSQILGQGIVGELAGFELPRLPLETLEWGNWKLLYPDTQVLSQDTGFARSYGRDPYSFYYASPGLMFPVENDDGRLHSKTLVYGVDLHGSAKAYPEDEIRSIRILNDEVGGEELLILWHPEKNVVSIFSRAVAERVLEFELREGRLFDIETGTEWNFNGVALGGELSGENLTVIVAPAHFWFAWAAFKPDTSLFIVP
jgi:peroxiredoxin